MVITAALSWLFTRTSPSCETVAAAMALALASRTIPSSCLILIFLSPHPGAQVAPGHTRIAGRPSNTFQLPRKLVPKSNDEQRHYFPWFGPDCSCDFQSSCDQKSPVV